MAAGLRKLGTLQTGSHPTHSDKVALVPTGVGGHRIRVGYIKQLGVLSLMASVPIQIVRYISDDQPGFVAGELRDAYGRIHVFEDKVPVIALGYPTAESDYPQPGVLGCKVIECWIAEDGRELARIDTEKPWAIDSTDGAYRFVVSAELVSDDD